MNDGSDTITITLSNNGTLVLSMDGWCEDNQRTHSRGFWFSSIDFMSSTMNLHLNMADGKTYKRTPMGDSWKPIKSKNRKYFDRLYSLPPNRIVEQANILEQWAEIFNSQNLGETEHIE